MVSSGLRRSPALLCRKYPAVSIRPAPLAIGGRSAAKRPKPLRQTPAGSPTNSMEARRRSRPGASGEEGQGLRRKPRRRVALVFSAPYAPNRNPDELVWKHIEADTVGRGAATWIATKPRAAGAPSSYALAARRHAKSRPGAVPRWGATSDAFAPAANVSAPILALSSGNRWRRRSKPTEISTRIDQTASNRDSRPPASPILPQKQGGPRRMDAESRGSKRSHAQPFGRRRPHADKAQSGVCPKATPQQRFSLERAVPRKRSSLLRLASLAARESRSCGALRRRLDMSLSLTAISSLHRSEP